MKKLGSLLAVLVLSANVSANESVAALSNLTIAAAETGSTIGWAIEHVDAAIDSRVEDSVEDRVEALNEKISANLQKSLEEKFRQELNF